MVGITIRRKKKTRNTHRLNNTLLNIEWVNNEIKEESKETLRQVKIDRWEGRRWRSKWQ